MYIYILCVYIYIYIDIYTNLRQLPEPLGPTGVSAPYNHLEPLPENLTCNT